MDNKDLMEQQMQQQELNQQRLQQQQLQRQMQKNRNNANNANAVKKLTNVASKSGNPYAMAAGKAVNAADKLTGGKASEKLGESLSKFNKRSGLKGKMMQKATNKFNGNSEKQQSPSSASLNTENAGKDTTMSKDALESGDGSVKILELPKLVKVGLIVMAPTLVVIIACCFIISSSVIFKVAVGLDNADSTSSDKAESKINKKAEKLDDGKEIKDDEVLEDETAYVDYTDSTFATNKLEKSNLVQTKKKNSLSDLDEIEDVFPAMKNEMEQYDEQTVYKFYYKMNKLYQYYLKNYNVKLDLSLLMSTLTVQSDDHYEIFKSNVEEDLGKSLWDKFKSLFSGKDDFSYDKDWSGYVTTSTSGPHDMEVLAQHMVSRSSSGCSNPAPDGNCYKLDIEQYNEFLKEFIEKKYYTKGESIGKFEPGGTPGNNTSVSGNSMAEAMVNLANVEYKNYDVSTTGKKYQEAYGLSRKDPWCAAFVWYISANTVYNGKHLYPDIIPFKSAGTGTYMRLFNTSSNPNINFYYNDNCKNLKGKNGNNTTYTPKPGDYIFIDWDAQFYDIKDGTQDHTGMVEKYENGYIYTIEGNRGIDIGKVDKAKYAINDCRVIGFGSWY